MRKELGEKRAPEREGVVFLLFKDGKLLLEERNLPGKAYFGYTIIPGGKLERDKDLNFDQAVEREVLEECGVRIKKAILLDSFLNVTPSNHLYQVSAYLVTEFDGEPQNREGKANHSWVTFEEAEEQLAFVGFKYVLALAKKAIIEEGLLEG